MLNQSENQPDTRYLVPSIHPSYARLLAAHVRSKGVDVEALFLGNSLSWDDLISKPGFISFEQFRKLALRASELSGNDRLELEISSMIEVSAHGPLGYGALAASTVRETFRLVQKMLATRISVIRLELTEEEEYARFSVVSMLNLQELEVFVMMMLLGSFIDLLEKTTGQKAPQIKVLFPFEKLEGISDYKARFPGVEFSFGHHCLEVLLPSDLLDQPCLTADEFAYRNAIRECEQILKQQGESGVLSRKVKSFLLEREGQFPSQEQVAEHFAMSVRTLIRHLKDEDSSYQILLDEVRKELVVWYLNDSSLSVEIVAEKLGYADTSNFSRVFRRWFKQTPSEFRKQLGARD